MKNMSINLRTCFMDKKSYEAARSVYFLNQYDFTEKENIGNWEEKIIIV